MDKLTKTLENVNLGARSSCGVSSTSSLVRWRIAPRMLSCRARSCKGIGFGIESGGNTRMIYRTTVSVYFVDCGCLWIPRCILDLTSIVAIFSVTIMAQTVIKLPLRESYSGNSFVCTPTYTCRGHPRSLCRVWSLPLC